MKTLSRQALYGIGMFAGAPLVIAAVLLRARRGPRPPTALAGASGFALLISLGLAAMSGLHILSYAYGAGGRRPFHLYPRYMDPAESGVLLAAVALAAWVFSSANDKEARERARTTLVRWILPLAVLAASTGPAWKIRGGRFPSRGYFVNTPLDGWYNFVFIAVVLLVLVTLMAWWSLGKYGTVWTVVAAVLFGWALSLQILLNTGRWDGSSPQVLPILQVEVLTAAPRAPIAVPIRRRAYSPRKLYKPAYRSDHPVYWPKLFDLQNWLAEHPDGFVLTRAWEHDPGHRLRLELVASTRRWRLWAPIGREDITDDLPNVDQ